MYRDYIAWFHRTGTVLFAALILTICVYLVEMDVGYAQSSKSDLSDSKSADDGWSIKSVSQPLSEVQSTTLATDSSKKTDQAAIDDAVDETLMSIDSEAIPKLIGTEFVDQPAQQMSVEVTQAPKPIVQVEPEITINPLSTQEQAQVDVLGAQQLTRDLEQQFQQLQQSMQTEDAFSSKLGEDYLGYGKLLREAGQIDESMKALINALHIAKVNNGIYSIEQRPALRELFDIHFDLSNTEDFEDYLQRIRWVESKNPEVRDNFSYELLLKVGNHYIDQFLRNPVSGQASVEMLLRAKYHLATAIRVYGKNPMSEMLMPYGELALASFLQSKIQPNDKTAALENSRLRRVNNLGGGDMALASYVEDPFPKGETYLQIYLRKAQKEGNTKQVVNALTSLGDFNQLFGRYSNAGRYYELAWLASQDLDQSQAGEVSFKQATLLPDFNYAYQRQNIPSNRETVAVSLLLNIGSDGRVKSVQRANPEDGLEKYFPRARRAVKRLVFRPQFADAKPVIVEQFPHITKVRLK